MAPDHDDQHHEPSTQTDEVGAARTPTPDDRELAAAWTRGDFARVRARVREIERDPSSGPEQRARARALLARVSVGVVVYVMLGFALLVFCAIVLRYVSA